MTPLRRRQSVFIRGFFGSLALFALGGCTLSPFYHRPEPPVAPAWPANSLTTSSGTLTGSSTIPAAELGWRDFFKDPLLQKLIELSLANNRDLRVAALNIQAARAQYQIQRAAILPTIDAAGEDNVQRLPSDLRVPGSPSVSREYSVGIGFTSYEFDLFGRIRSLSKAALEQYFSLAETRRSVQISLISELATAYMTWLADGELLTLTKNTLASQQASYDLSKRQFDAGVITALDLRQAESSVDIARVNLALYTRQKAQAENAVVLLLGTPVPPGLSPGNAYDDQQLLAELPAGIPSEVLIRRPDILAAEYQLRSANANIGAARAAFFPSITLTGSYGTASTTLDGLFKGDSRAWNFNPQVTMPLFAAGANIANLKLANVQKNVYIAQYEKAIQVAFREVADGLAGRSTLDDQTAAQQSLVDASSTTYVLSDMRFRSGIDNYLTVLVSQRSLYSAQQDLINVKLLRLENLITLYKALGGGWNEHTPTESKPANTTPPVNPSLPEPPASGSALTTTPAPNGQPTTVPAVLASTQAATSPVVNQSSSTASSVTPSSATVSAPAASTTTVTTPPTGSKP